MREVLGYRNFCSACQGGQKENGELVCRDKDGRFYGLPVKHVLMAPCMKRRNTSEVEIMRRKLTKAERMQVYEKCQGRCAYCGCDLEYKDMQVDHVTPLRIGGADELHNMLPACRSCNHYKATLDVEGYRKYLAGISHRLMRNSIPFQVGVRFGLVRHVKDDVVFYFETLN